MVKPRQKGSGSTGPGSGSRKELSSADSTETTAIGLEAAAWSTRELSSAERTDTSAIGLEAAAGDDSVGLVAAEREAITGS